MIEEKGNDVYKLKLDDKESKKKRFITCHVSRMKKYCTTSDCVAKRSGYITLLSIMLLCMIKSASSEFNRVDPILREETNIPHIAGINDWQMRMIVLNPCEALFGNVTLQ